MKKIVEVEKLICDICGKGPAYEWTACSVCGTDFCHDCMETHAVQYHAGVFIQGSGDIVYCKECDSKTHDEKHCAYVAVARLKQEAQEWDKSWRSRVKIAEDQLKLLIK